jgi:uncharacterized membrane protein YbhN (UPF0104 family)
VSRHATSTWLGALVSVVSLAAVGWWISRQGAPHLPSSAVGFAWLGAAMCVIAVNFGVRGWRWHLILRSAGIPHRERDAFGLTLVGYMGNNVLPARGGDVLKIVLLGARTTARRREVLGTVVVERVLDAGVLAVMFIVLTWAGVDALPGGRGGGAAVTAGLLAVAAALALYLRLRRRGRFERFAGAIRPVAGAMRPLTRSAGIPLALISLGIWCIDTVSLLLIARSLGIELAAVGALAVVVLASLAVAIPAAPGYVGTFDAGMLLGLHAAGVKGADAVSVLLLARFLLFVPVTLAGLVTLVFGYRGSRATPREDDLVQVAEQRVGMEQVEPA